MAHDFFFFFLILIGSRDFHFSVLNERVSKITIFSAQNQWSTIELRPRAQAHKIPNPVSPCPERHRTTPHSEGALRCRFSKL